MSVERKVDKRCPFIPRGCSCFIFIFSRSLYFFSFLFYLSPVVMPLFSSSFETPSIVQNEKDSNKSNKWMNIEIQEEKKKKEKWDDEVMKYRRKEADSYFIPFSYLLLFHPHHSFDRWLVRLENEEDRSPRTQCLPLPFIIEFTGCRSSSPTPFTLIQRNRLKGVLFSCCFCWEAVKMTYSLTH